MSHELFERHRSLLEKAVNAIHARTYWSAYPEVPSGKIYDIADIAADAHYRARDMIQEFRLADGQPVTLPAIVPKLSETPGETKWLGPRLGEHTAEILGALGYAADEQERLKRLGVT